MLDSMMLSDLWSEFRAIHGTMEYVAGIPMPSTVGAMSKCGSDVFLERLKGEKLLGHEHQYFKPHLLLVGKLKLSVTGDLTGSRSFNLDLADHDGGN